MRAMKTTAILAGLVLSLAAATARAQETTPPQPPQPPDDEEQVLPRKTIHVLENPYDIASFYRSHQAEEYFGYQYPGMVGPGGYGSYPISGYYRQGGAHGFGFSRFWSFGYAHRAGAFPRFRRRIGDNGDLYLIAPFLAPVGPLSGAFLGDGN